MLPATAQQSETPEVESDLAPVVSLSSRRASVTTVEPPAPPVFGDDEAQRRASEFWGAVMKREGIDLGEARTALVVKVVAKEMERLVGSLVMVREGYGDRLPADPNAGLDRTGALEVTGLLRELGGFAEQVEADRPV